MTTTELIQDGASFPFSTAEAHKILRALDAEGWKAHETETFRFVRGDQSAKFLLQARGGFHYFVVAISASQR